MAFPLLSLSLYNIRVDVFCISHRGKHCMFRGRTICILQLVCVMFATHTFADDEADLWPVRPLVRPAVPTGHPIDAFLGQVHAEQGLKPVGRASPEAILRRVYFDLIGLPPTLEQLDAFLNDESTNAYEKVVDQLLADPQHGVRYARHWLDLLRYIDVDGGMPAASGIYRWRDWVISSLNRDLPYDKFVRAQIAGDLSENDEDRFATGFLARAARSKSGGHELAFGAVDTISSVFLGMTVACAKCHDHFFDSISQQEYYQMKALFDGLALHKETLATDEEIVGHEKVLELWEAKKKAIQVRLDEITDPYYPALYEERLKLLPPKVEAIYRKPKDERTKDEQKLAADYAPVVLIDARKFRDALPPKKTERYESIRQTLVKLNRDPPALPVFWSVQEQKPDKKRQSHILDSAEPGQPLEKVTPGFPFSNIEIDPAEPAPRQIFLDWLTAPDNVLFARVAVNRIWQWHFGEALMATPSDFGNNGAEISHSELLDWLASEFIEQDYSMKAIHRLIVTSAAYRRATTGDSQLLASNGAIDPQNTSLWKFRLKRLEAEIIRDAVLFAAGELDLTVGGKSFRAVKAVRRRNSGPTVGDYDDRTNRRGIYMGRGNGSSLEMMPEMLQVFNAEDGQTTCPVRQRTITAPQALYMLNSELTEQSAVRMGERLQKLSAGDLHEAVNLGYRIALSRFPSSAEREHAFTFLTDDPTRLGDFCWLLMNLTEFIFVK